MEISYQLYTSRNFPIEETLRALAENGVEYVEGFDPLYANPEETAALLKKYNLRMPTAHMGVQDLDTSILETQFDDLMRAADILDVQTVIAPYIAPEDRPKDAAGWQAFADNLANWANKVTKTGRRFAWHNHDFEFMPLPDGTLPIDIILGASDAINSEMDLAWVRVAERDPAKELAKRGDRVIAVHVKDLAPKGENLDEDGWAYIGQGVMDWPSIVEVLPQTKVEFGVMEHDNPKDPVAFINASAPFAKKL